MFLLNLFISQPVCAWTDLYYLAAAVIYCGSIYIEKEGLGPFAFETYWGC